MKKPQDLVEINSIDSSIITDVKYATSDNFMGRPLYNSGKAYLREEVVKALVKAQKQFSKRHFKIKIWDAYRPFSVQEQMWAVLPNEQFLAKPVREGQALVSGSKHSRGAAVDLTLVDSQGNDLPMPTYFDDFSERAHRLHEPEDKAIKANVLLLEKVMVDEGFLPLPAEWWHFDWKEWKRFDLLDFTF